MSSRGSASVQASWLDVLAEPVDAAGLAAFRILFGALMVFAVVRFVAKGWVQDLYIAPAYHFTYDGFSWVRPWPAWGMYLHFLLMGVAALLVMVGAWTRIAAASFFVLFTYAELIDKTTYLNHYYFVSLVALLLVFVPSDAMASVATRQRRRRGQTSQHDSKVGRWAYVLLRAQIGIVYFCAGFAKLNGDWLFRAQPLRIWLQAYADMPLIGPLITQPAVAFGMSWAGAVFDLSIAGFLLWPKTRRLAYTVAIIFHTAIWILFPIGVFSWVMLVAATIFFAPSWPRGLLEILRRRGWITTRVENVVTAHSSEKVVDRMWREYVRHGQAQVTRTLRWRMGLAFAAVYILIQVLVPMRFVAFPGAVNWTEEGFRFAWCVMLIEKTGTVEFRVKTRNPDGQYVVYPSQELTPLQYKMMSTQPDMIQQYATHVARRFLAQGCQSVQVFAQAWASLNGREGQLLIDPTVDLAAARPSMAHQSWIVPLKSQTN